MKVCDKTCIFFFFPIMNKYLLMAKRSLLSRCPMYVPPFEVCLILCSVSMIEVNNLNVTQFLLSRFSSVSSSNPLVSKKKFLHWAFTECHSFSTFLDTSNTLTMLTLNIPSTSCLQSIILKLLHSSSFSCSIHV